MSITGLHAKLFLKIGPSFIEGGPRISGRSSDNNRQKDDIVFALNTISWASVLMRSAIEASRASWVEHYIYCPSYARLGQYI
jgi:hypothetical protein